MGNYEKGLSRMIKDLGFNTIDHSWYESTFTGLEDNSDVTIEDNELTILVPGFCKDDFDITVSGDILTIKAEKEKYGVIDKSFKLSTFVTGVDIMVFNGILTATFIKKPSNVEINLHD